MKFRITQRQVHESDTAGEYELDIIFTNWNTDTAMFQNKLLKELVRWGYSQVLQSAQKKWEKKGGGIGERN